MSIRRLIGLALLACSAAPAAPVRTLIFSGRNNHDWRTTTPYLRKLLQDSGRFDVRVTEEPSGTTAKTLAGYDLIIVDYNGPRWGEVTEKAVEEFVRSGKGLVGIHGASYAFGGLVVLGDRHVKTGLIEPTWPAYAEMMGASWSEEAPKTGHAPRHTFTVKIADSDHPITRGMSGSFRINDELYHSQHMRPGNYILATAFDDPKIGGTGKDEPIMWTRSYGQGRVFFTSLGHDVGAEQEAGFIVSFLRGSEWAGTGAVTLPATWDGGPRGGTPPVRVELVTGGHDHDASFYGVLEGNRDLAVTVNPHPNAYSRDLRDRFDVVVLYDLVQEASGRKNLQDFVESGKGVVVLHHAIADFNDWPWWCEQVVGGKYLMKPANGMPASTYKHDEELDVRPVVDHPVTKGVGAFRIFDETYKGMWISPKVKVLLKTDNPTSDGPVAWISPYEKSRVIYIELGHDRKAHENPAYRTLVHNAILWAAGKM
jgi:type 1 glutamine amidotransferase